MDDEGFKALACAMVVGDRIDTMVVSEVIKTMLGECMETCAPPLGTVCLNAAARGATSRSSAFEAEGSFLYAPECGSPYHGALAIETSSNLFVVVVEWRGKPNDAVDRAVDKLLGKKTPSTPRPPDLTQVDRICAYRLPPGGDVRTAIASVVSDTWSPDQLVARSMSIAPWPGGGGLWIEGHTNLNREGFDLWREFSAALRATLSAAGLSDQVAARSRQMAEREPYNAGSACYAASRSFGRELVHGEGGIPGPAAERRLTLLQSTAAEMDVDALIGSGQLAEVFDACVRRGHVGAADAFVFNDLDDSVYAVATEYGCLLAIRDHGRRYTAVLGRGDAGIPVSLKVFGGTSDADTESYGALAEFDVCNRSASAVRMRTEADAVRAWNSFVSTIESAHCCLGEEYGSAPAP